MNYRHAFHAGNPADCMKHALLVWIMHALARKPAPLFVLDTHAGLGRYDLQSGPAERTGEWHAGIARLLHDPPPPLTDYVALVERLGLYPGSPALLRSLLRPDDRMACCELHAEDYAGLVRLFRSDRHVAVHFRDGYEAIAALLPPRQARGLVLIDPPFEAPGEFDRMLAGLQAGAARFAGGIYAAWYPIKHRSPIRAFHDAVRGARLRDVVCAELWWREPIDPARLNGCGLLVRNPPWGFEVAARDILMALLDRFGNTETARGHALVRLTDE